MRSFPAWLIIIAAVIACGPRGTGESPVIDTSQPSSIDTSATTTGDTGGTSTVLTAEEKTFLVGAGSAGAAEIVLGRIALDRSSNAEVKAFAQRMVDDHGKANQELIKLATDTGVGLATGPTDEQRDLSTKLTTVDAAQFDRQYMAAMVADHDNAVKQFRAAAGFVVEDDLRAWVMKSLPVLEEHHRMAVELQKKLK